MCGIVGYIGNNAKENSIENLKNLEYRGYDSAGIAFFEDDYLYVIKEKGYIDNIIKKSKHHSKNINICIGHTRWATTGVASKKNAHPHLSNNKKFAIVHNGIIENYQYLKQDLLTKGYKFNSETDTEVIANLIEENAKHETNIIKIIENTTKVIKGSYAFAILCTDSPDKIYVTKYNMPLFLTINEDFVALASAVIGLPKSTTKYIMLENNDIALLSLSDSIVYNNNTIVHRNIKKLKSTESHAHNKNYKHFMLKEILEQQTAIKKTSENFFSPKNKYKQIILKQFDNISRIHLIGCGTAYHACLVGAKLLNNIGYDTSCHIASEFKYNPPSKLKDSLCIFVSQSGETADTLGSLRLAKKLGAKTLGITNVESSTLAHEVGDFILTNAGIEIAVASTKAYTCQCFIFYLILNILDENLQKTSIKQLKINQVIQNYINYKKFAKIINNYAKIFFIGRGFDSITAMEASLKLKEISYIMSESYPAGELKHGTLALIDSNSLSVIISTNKDMLPKILNTIDEIKSRGGKTLIVSQFEELKNSADIFIKLPYLKNEKLYAITSIIPLQLIAYYSCCLKGFNPDKPRNLAKSVTVE